MRDETVREIEQFLYREARLLDERRFHEWLELFTEDVRYSHVDARQPLRAVEQVDRDPRSRPDMSRRTRRVRTRSRSSTRPRRAWPGASRGWRPAWPGPRTRPRAPATLSPTSKWRRAAHPRKSPPNSKSTATSSSTRAGRRPSRIFMSAPAATSCAGSAASGRSPTAELTLDQNVLLAKNISIFF